LLKVEPYQRLIDSGMLYIEWAPKPNYTVVIKDYELKGRDFSTKGTIRGEVDLYGATLLLTDISTVSVGHIPFVPSRVDFTLRDGEWILVGKPIEEFRPTASARPTGFKMHFPKNPDG